MSSIWSCLFFILFSGIWSRPLIVFYTILVYLSIWHLIFNRNSDYTSTSVHLFQYSIVISTFLCYIFFFYVCIGIESIIRTESANKFLQQMIMHGYQSAATEKRKHPWATVLALNVYMWHDFAISVSYCFQLKQSDLDIIRRWN